MPIRNNLQRADKLYESQQRKKARKSEIRKSRAKPGAKRMRHTVVNGRWGLEMREEK